MQFYVFCYNFTDHLRGMEYNFIKVVSLFVKRDKEHDNNSTR
jgi:hypothetical protein